MEERKFMLPEFWNGGFYELAMEIGERSDDRLLAALIAVWKHPKLKGCYLRNDREAIDQEQVVPNFQHIKSGSHLMGLATLPNAEQVACGTVPIREDEGIDWLTLYVPMGALSTVYTVGGFPFDKDKHQDWRILLENWFAEIGETVHQTAKFQLGLIGFEVSGEIYSSEVTAKGIPEDRRMGYLRVENEQIQYYPTTIW